MYIYICVYIYVYVNKYNTKYIFFIFQNFYNTKLIIKYDVRRTLIMVVNNKNLTIICFKNIFKLEDLILINFCYY